MSRPDPALGERRERVVREHMASENRHEFDVTMGTFGHPRYEIIPTGEIHDGLAAVTEYFRTSRQAFPDQRNENAVFHQARDAVIVEFDLLGTHDGELHGIPATGRRFCCCMVAFFLFPPGSDKISCERVYFDQTTIAQQLFDSSPDPPSRTRLPQRTP